MNASFKKFMFYVLLIILISGCVAHSGVMRKVKLGMTREKVIQTLGKPVSISKKDNREYLNYKLIENFIADFVPTPYFVEIIDGKVKSFGRVGDFITTDLNIEKEQ